MTSRPHVPHIEPYRHLWFLIREVLGSECLGNFLKENLENNRFDQEVLEIRTVSRRTENLVEVQQLKTDE